MADVIPQQRFVTKAVDQDHGNQLSETLYTQPLMYAVPEPNPAFVFPLEPEVGPAPGTGSRCTNPDASRGRRLINRSRPQQLSFNALPAFEFHPSVSEGSTSSSRSLSRSPTFNMPIPGHPGGHRRNGSEFIGGDGRNGGLGLMSTSPTKGEGALPTPAKARTPPSGSRLGHAHHAHRRSGAISSHDVSKIIKPLNEPKGGSAPTTPSLPVDQPAHPPGIERAASQPVCIQSKPNPLTSADYVEPVSAVSHSRPRVGFSDTVEFIPRPLSTISSETASSLSTIRANHSLTGSITSIVSASTSSSPLSKTTRPLSEPILPKLQPRPRTASPTSCDFQSDRESGESFPPSKRPSSASAAECSFMAAASSASMITSRSIIGAELSQNISYRDLEDFEPSPSPDLVGSSVFKRPPTPSANSPPSRCKTSPGPKVAKRQRKVRTWAGSILSRKARHRVPKEKLVTRRSPTPPLQSLVPDEEFCLEDINFDEDTSCVIVTPTDQASEPSRAITDIASWKPREASPNSDSDGSIAILDLDAALGPFGTLDAGADPDDSAARGLSLARRRMHSSGTTGGFYGSGMHYHRRTESLPEMAAINYHPFGFPRLGSNLTMADVFEEEEEEDRHIQKEEAASSEPPQNASGKEPSEIGLVLEISSSDYTSPALERPGPDSKAKSLGSNDFPIQSIRGGQESAAGFPGSDIVPNRLAPVKIVNTDEEPCGEMVVGPSDKSPITPASSDGLFTHRPASAPIDFAMRKPAFLYTTPDPSSCVSSPEFNRTSFDIPRMHTANSSITDRATLDSSRMGENGLSLRGSSVDDVPSLTSSASTVISAYPSRFSTSLGTRPEGVRSSSLSGPSSNNRSGSPNKRSSLASLSRLVGSSYSEKSKLHIEERVSPDNVEKLEKRKGNRISRLMRFWRFKEKPSSA